MRKKILIVTVMMSGIIAAGIIFFIGINAHIKNSSKDAIYSEVNDLPQAQAVMILGARVFQDGRLSDMLKDRTDTAIQVYREGKAEKILMSGDNGQEEYDEVNAVKEYLLKNNIPEEDIFLDHAGFDTYDSLYRAKEIFQAESLIISTQDFHLKRAIYIGDELGIKTVGIVADKRNYGNVAYNERREYLARTKSWFDVFFDAKPTFKGDNIPITGDGRKSWD